MRLTKSLDNVENRIRTEHPELKIFIVTAICEKQEKAK